MTDFNIMTQEIAEIDKTITLLKTKRERLLAKEASKKAKALASEIAKRKAK
jgi:uncharacterized small protein (DUF1192 family)